MKPSIYENRNGADQLDTNSEKDLKFLPNFLFVRQRALLGAQSRPASINQAMAERGVVASVRRLTPAPGAHSTAWRIVAATSLRWTPGVVVQRFLRPPRFHANRAIINGYTTLRLTSEEPCR